MKLAVLHPPGPPKSSAPPPGPSRLRVFVPLGPVGHTKQVGAIPRGNLLKTRHCLLSDWGICISYSPKPPVPPGHILYPFSWECNY